MNRAFACLLAVLFCVTAGTAQTASLVAPESIYVPTGPGTGLDSLGRTIAYFLKETTGQEVRVINLPGAGGARAFQQLVLEGKKGQLTLVQSGPLLDSVLDPESEVVSGWDTKIEILAGISNRVSCVANPSVIGAETLIQLQKGNPATLPIIGVVAGANLELQAAVVKDLLNQGRTRVRSVSGYQDSARLWLALEQREVDIICIADDFTRERIARRDSLFKKVLILSSGLPGSEESLSWGSLLPHGDRIKKEALDFLQNKDTFGRLLLARKDEPHAVWEAHLRQLFEKNKAFQERLRQLGLLDTVFVSKSETVRRIKNIQETPTDVLRYLRAARKGVR